MTQQAPATEWCDVHRGYVDEGRIRPMGAGSSYAICDACAETSLELHAVKSTTGQIVAALHVLTDYSGSIEDRAAAYAVVHQVQLRLNRLLRTVQPEIVRHVGALPGRRLGPLTVVGQSIGVAWPCNDPSNWGDEIVQGALAALADHPDARRYVRQVPRHFEIDTKAIAEGFAEGDPSLPALHAELTRKGFRTAERRTDRLKVREA